MQQYKVNTHFNEKVEANSLNDLISRFLINFLDEMLYSNEYNDIISSDITLNL